jgi:hypothetical protein
VYAHESTAGFDVVAEGEALDVCVEDVVVCGGEDDDFVFGQILLLKHRCIIRYFHVKTLFSA